MSGKVGEGEWEVLLSERDLPLQIGCVWEILLTALREKLPLHSAFAKNTKYTFFFLLM